MWDSDHGDYEPFHRLRLARAFADYLTDPIDGIRVTGILANGETLEAALRVKVLGREPILAGATESGRIERTRGRDRRCNPSDPGFGSSAKVGQCDVKGSSPEVDYQ